MKRVICAGKLPASAQLKPSEQLMGLFNEQRVFNIHHEITGVFFVHQQIVLQVLEGAGQPLAEAVYRLGKDHRLEDFNIFANEKIKSPIFSKWQVRFHHPNSSTHIEFMRRLKSMITPQAEFQSTNSKHLFKELFADSLESDADPTPLLNADATVHACSESSAAIGFLGMSLSMTSWPKPTQVKLSSAVMKTCSLLCQCSVSYTKLSEQAIWNSVAELDAFLLDMQRLGILLTSPLADVATKPEVTQSQDLAPPKTDRFSQLLKRFISSPKVQVN